MEYDLILSIGSNMGNKIKNLYHAINELKKYFTFVKASYLYETEPVDFTEQDLFYNICVYFKTEINEPEKILSIIKKIENHLGRIKNIQIPKGPRIIDIDIILFDNITIFKEDLIIPHKEFLKRNFVLIPLLDILDNNSNYLIKYDIYNRISQNKGIVKKIGDFIC